MKESAITEGLEDLYKIGRRSFKDLQAGEVGELCAALILHGDRELAKDALAQLDDPLSILFGAAKYWKTGDADYRSDMMGDLMKQVGKFYEMTINDLFKQYAEELDQIEQEALPAYKRSNWQPPQTSYSY